MTIEHIHTRTESSTAVPILVLIEAAEARATDRPWRAAAACLRHDPELWFPASKLPEASGTALAICRACPVRAACLAAALDGGESGVWGATTETDRRTMTGPWRRLTADSGPVPDERCNAGHPQNAATIGARGVCRMCAENAAHSRVRQQREQRAATAVRLPMPAWVS